MTSKKLSAEAQTFLVRATAYLDVIFRPVRLPFLTQNAPAVIWAARRSGLKQLRGVNSSVANRKRSERARTALAAAGYMARGELTPAGRRLARSWTQPNSRDVVREAVRRIKLCLDRGWFRDRDGHWVPETFIAGEPWGGASSDAFASLQMALTPALADGWMMSRCTMLGGAFYGLDPAADTDRAIEDSVPDEWNLDENLCQLYLDELDAVAMWIANSTEKFANIGELPLAVGEPLQDESKAYSDCTGFPPLFR